MKIIKNNGEEVNFVKSKIYNSISKANVRVSVDKRLSNDKIKQITKDIEAYVRKATQFLRPMIFRFLLRMP